MSLGALALPVHDRLELLVMAVTTALPTLNRNDSAMEQPLAETNASRENTVTPTSKPLDILILGMCSGAALDGVSCALIRYRQQSPDEPLRMALLKYEEAHVPPQLRTRILNLLRDHPSNPNAMMLVHRSIGYMYSAAAACFCSNHNIPIESIDLIASRADSIPPSVTPAMPPSQVRSETNPAFQSWTAVVASETSVTTATNLPTTRRPVNEHDPTAGPPIDSLFLQHPEKFRVCITINEVLIITVIPPSNDKATPAPPSTVCGPGTMFIDYAMRYATSNRVQNTRNYDGSYASQDTKINQGVVDRFLEANDYTDRAPPLSIATEMFGHHELQGVIDECLFLGMSDYDTVATVTRITAENIVRQYRRLIDKYCPSGQKVDEIFICGPGARNTDIIDYLEEVLPEEIVTRPLDDIGIPGDAKEALCCAHLGLEILLNYAVNEDGPFEIRQQNGNMGSVVPGKRWPTVRERVVRFTQGKRVPAVQRVVVEK